MFKKTVFILIIISILLSLCVISSTAILDESTNQRVSEPETFASPLTGIGKRFEDGIIEPVLNAENLDISISSFLFSENEQENVYDLSFLYNGDSFSLSGYLIPAKFNNYYNDHFLLSPTSFTSVSEEEYEFTKVLIAFNANEHDLLPPNQYMIGQTVITIWLTEQSSGDLLMWQVLIPAQVCSNTFSSNSLDITEENENLTVLANEYFFAEENSISVEINKEDFDLDAAAIAAGTFINADDPALSADQLSLNDVIVSRSEASATNNPYYAQGIPNYIFQTANNQWRKGGSTNNSSLKYISYSFYGPNTTAIYTHIMLLEVYGNMQADNPIIQSGQTLYTANYFMQMKIVATSTVIYNGSEYNLMLGGEEMIKIQDPVIKIEKSGNYAGHCVYKNLPSGLGRKGASTARLLQVSFREVLNNNWTLGNIAYNIVSYVPSLTIAFGEPAEWNPIASEQLNNYTKIIGTQEETMDGYIYRFGDFFNQRTWFAAPTQSVAGRITWSAVYEGSFT